MPLNTTWLLPKILWLRNHEPQNWEKVRKVIQLQDYVLKAFGAEEYVNDIPGAGLTGFWNPYESCWSSKLLSLFSIDPGLLPKPAALRHAGGRRLESRRGAKRICRRHSPVRRRGGSKQRHHRGGNRQSRLLLGLAGHRGNRRHVPR